MYNDFYEEEDSKQYEEMQEVHINDVFFVRAIDFYKLGIHPMGFFGTIPNDYNKEEANNKYNDFLFAVKYIGDGIFIEMSTGMKLALHSASASEIKIDGDPDEMFNFYFWEDFDEYTYKKVIDSFERDRELTQKQYDEDGKRKSNFNFWDEITETEKEKLFNNYIIDCEKYKKIPTVAPILGLFLQYKEDSGYTQVIKINDYSKKKYLEHTDEERMDLLNEFIKESKNSFKEACDKIDEKVNELSEILSKRVDTPTSEDLNMAYLENELYDFQKGRSR